MHILTIPSFLPPYGGAFAIEQSKALCRAGQKVGVIHCQQLGVTIYPRHYVTAPYTTWEETIDCGDGRQIKLLRTNMRGVPRLIRLNQQRYCQLVRRLYRRYVSLYGRPDIIHAHCTQWAGVAAMQISEQDGVPYVITEHISGMMFRNAYGDGWTRHRWARSLMQRALERAKNVITVSDIVVKDLREFFGERFGINIISNVIDTGFFHYAEREAPCGRPYRYCCCAVSNKDMLHLKGYDTLLEAYGRMDDDSELHIAGRATHSQAMQDMIERYVPEHRRNRVIIHGDLTKEGVRSLLYASDALVLASRSEVQPLVILEALSTGLPVVTTDAVPWYDSYAGAVLVSPSGDADGLHDNLLAVKEILPSPRHHDIVREMAAPETVAERLISVFQK